MKGAGLGGCLVSNNILRGTGKIKWCIKDEPADELDNGWRFLSDIDTEEYLNDVANWRVCDWNTIVEIEPAVLSIFDLPTGTELEFIDGAKKKYFVKLEPKD